MHVSGAWSVPRQAVALLGAWLALSCGGKYARHDPSGNEPSGGTGAVTLEPPAVPQNRLCFGTLQVDGYEARELDCGSGMQAIRAGLFRVSLSSSLGDSVAITLPAAETGFYGTLDCANAVIAVSELGRVYSGDQLKFPDAVVAAHVEAAADSISINIEGEFCDGRLTYPNDPAGPYCVSARLKDIRAPLIRAEPDCGACGPSRRLDDRCEFSTCAGNSCVREYCPSQATLCRFPAAQ